MKTHGPLDIGLDVDNVLYPFSEVMTSWAERRKGLAPGSLDHVARSWSWYKDQWGMTSEEFLRLYARGVRAGVIFTEGAPKPGALNAVEALYARGHRLHYVTDRAFPGVTAAVAFHKTAEWLARWGFPVHSLTISKDKAAVRTDVFLDDGAHNIDALTEAGHPCPVVWSMRHNRRHPGRRVSTWGEFVALVDDLSPPSAA